jgi:polysaccharide export outer membrane protein
MKQRQGKEKSLAPARSGSLLRCLLAVLASAALLTFCPQGRAAQSREALGGGDTIRVTVFQNPDLTTEARISEGGAILFPLIGKVVLGGQTPQDAAHRIATHLKQGGFMKNPQVSVNVIQVRSHQVSVLGLVGKPGKYALEDAKVKLTDVLALAGGIIPGGDDTVTIVSSRGGKVIKTEVDVPAIYRSGSASVNPDIQSGDTVFVPRAPTFYIYGEVQRPGNYRLEPNVTVMHALSLGGGLTLRGTERGLKISRRMSDGTLKKIDVQTGDPVQPDDVIYVRESWF